MTDISEKPADPFLCTDLRCGVCSGEAGWIRRGERCYCEFCGGSGVRLTELGAAIWELAQRAHEAKRQQLSEDGSPNE